LVDSVAGPQNGRGEFEWPLSGKLGGDDEGLQLAGQRHL